MKEWMVTEGSVWRLIQRKPDSVSRNPPSKEQEDYCDKSSGQHVQRPGDEGGARCLWKTAIIGTNGGWSLYVVG